MVAEAVAACYSQNEHCPCARVTVSSVHLAHSRSVSTCQPSGCVLRLSASALPPGQRSREPGNRGQPAAMLPLKRSLTDSEASSVGPPCGGLHPQRGGAVGTEAVGSSPTRTEVPHGGGTPVL